MKHHQFAIELLKIIPPAIDFERLGLNQSFIEMFKASKTCVPKPINKTEEDEFLNLIANYDVSRVNIGSVYFSKQIKKTPLGILLGHVDTDFVVLNLKTKEIIVVDYNSPKHILWHCANTSDLFFDAIIFAADHLKQAMFDDKYFQDQEFIKSNAMICANLAGGNDYLNFYLMLLGAE